MPGAQVLLISTPVISERERFYIPDFEIPLNVCYLASALEAGGISAGIVDMNVADRGFSLEQFVSETKPAVAAFAAYTPFIHVANEYAAKLKDALPGITTIVGGYHASALPENTLQEFSAFDYLVYGEGEETLRELCAKIISGQAPHGIPGVCRRSDAGRVIKEDPRKQSERIDSFPFPARHKLDQNKYKVNPINYVELPTTGILASRGCERRCAFCSQSVFRGARVRSASNIVEEVKQCRTDFGMRGFRFYDDNLTAYRDTCMEFCGLLLKGNIRISWNCFSRVDNVDAELLRTMKRAGCHQVKFGVETGTEKMLKVINKGITLDQSRQAVKLAGKAGIEAQVSIILGLPGETEADMLETIAFVKSISPDLAGFNLFKPMPGSPLFKKLDANGGLLHRNWPEYSIKQTRPVIADSCSKATLEKMLSKAYLSFFLRPGYVIQRLKWFVRHPRREALRVAVGLKYMWLNLSARGDR